MRVEGYARNRGVQTARLAWVRKDLRFCDVYAAGWKNSQPPAAQRVALKMGRRLSGVPPDRFRIALDTNQHFFAALNAIQRGKSFGRRDLAYRILEKLDQLMINVRIQRNLPSLQPVLLYSASIS